MFWSSLFINKEQKTLAKQSNEAYHHLALIFVAGWNVDCCLHEDIWLNLLAELRWFNDFNGLAVLHVKHYTYLPRSSSDSNHLVFPGFTFPPNKPVS